MLKKLGLQQEQFEGRTRRWEKHWVPCMRGLEGGEVRSELIRWVPTDEITQPVYESRYPHLKPYRNASSKLYLQPHSTFPAEEQEEQAQQQPDAQQPQQQQDHQQQQQHLPSPSLQTTTAPCGPSSAAPLAPPPPQPPRSHPTQPPQPPQHAGPGGPSAMDMS